MLRHSASINPARFDRRTFTGKSAENHELVFAERHSCRSQPTREHNVPEKQKPTDKLASDAGKALKDPKTASPRVIRSLAARVLDSEKNDPQPHKKGK